MIILYISKILFRGWKTTSIIDGLVLVFVIANVGIGGGASLICSLPSCPETRRFTWKSVTVSGSRSFAVFVVYIEGDYSIIIDLLYRYFYSSLYNC